jgi:hypothetical protein
MMNALIPASATGARLPPPVAAAVVKLVLSVAPQVVLAPAAFLGAIYQLYRVPGVNSVA